MKPIIASLLLLAALPACKKDKDAPKAGSASVPAPVADAAAAVVADAPAGSGSASGDLDPADFEGPTEKVVKEAFGGKPPALPMLSKDGTTAAVDLGESIGLSDMSTYVVGFQDVKGKVDRVVLLDDKEATVEDLQVTDKLKAKATALAKRLSDGGFTAFEKAIERQPEDDKPVELGTLGKLSLKQGDGGGPDVGATSLELTLVDATGKQVAKEAIKAIPPGKQPGQCGSEPRLGDVWYDAPRKRVLVSIRYITGGDDCDTDAGVYRFWAM